MNKTLCSSLIIWLDTFPGHGTLSSSKLTDGVELGAILHEIAPEYFTNQWLSKIRTDVVDNWRLKVSNLKKIYQGLMDFFYHTELPIDALQLFPSPDINKIVEGDETELGRLLQLILGCAINCEQKQKHIEGIMKLEESVQTLIVNAIQELMNAENASGSPDSTAGSLSTGVWPGGPTSFGPQIKTLTEQLENMSVEKEKLSRRCNELDLQISILGEDKRTLKDENEKLRERIDIFEAGEDVGGQSFRSKDLRKQVETLQDELFKIESSRDEYRSRVDGLEKENKDLAVRSEELQVLAEEARSLKDEVDALRDMSERVAVYEGTVESYKKKLEELSDLKRQVKILEERNGEYMRQNMELEEEIKKSGTWRPQLDLYKKQVSDLHQKLADESKKTDRQVFENKKLSDKLEALTQEKHRTVLERDVLKESVEELKCTVSALNCPESASKSPGDLPDIETLEIIPPEIREKLVRLQHENRVLKQRVSDKSEESSSVLQSIVNDLQERHDKLLQENRDLNRRIMVLESDVEDAKSVKTVSAGASALPESVSDLDEKLREKEEKILSLEESLQKKETEMVAMEERYKKYLNKAKSVIKTLDPKHNAGIVPEVSAIRSQLMEKEKQIENLEKEREKSKAIREVEDRLISTAFYNFGMQMHRQMISQRLSPLENSQSFLSRQRQVSSRRSMNNNPSSSQYFDY